MCRLDNSIRGLICEFGLITLLTTLFMRLILQLNTDMDVLNAFIITTAVFFINFYVIRVVRLSMVYRNHIWLKILNLPGIGMLLATGQTVVQNPDLINLLTFSIFLAFFLLLILVIRYHGRFKVYRHQIAPERYASLRSVMTKKQRISLVFPDKYIKFLETGDVNYLTGNNLK